MWNIEVEPIMGCCIGLELFDDEMLGKGVMFDLVILRVLISKWA